MRIRNKELNILRLLPISWQAVISFISLVTLSNIIRLIMPHTVRAISARTNIHSVQIVIVICRQKSCCCCCCCCRRKLGKLTQKSVVSSLSAWKVFWHAFLEASFPFPLTLPLLSCCCLPPAAKLPKYETFWMQNFWGENYNRDKNYENIFGVCNLRRRRQRRRRQLGSTSSNKFAAATSGKENYK